MYEDAFPILHRRVYVSGFFVGRVLLVGRRQPGLNCTNTGLVCFFDAEEQANIHRRIT